MSGFPKTMPVSVICSEGLQSSSYNCTHGCDLFQRTNDEIGKGKRCMSDVQRKPGASFQGSSPSGVTQDSIPPATNCDNTGEMLSIGNLVRDSMPRVFTGGIIIQAYLPSKYQNSRLSEGQQVFITNHIIV